MSLVNCEQRRQRPHTLKNKTYQKIIEVHDHKIEILDYLNIVFEYTF